MFPIRFSEFLPALFGPFEAVEPHSTLYAIRPRSEAASYLGVARPLSLSVGDEDPELGNVGLAGCST